MPSLLPGITAGVQSASTTELRLTLVLEFEDRELVVDQDRIRIGSSPQCEIRLPQGPLLHSVLRSESGVVWIEADDDEADLKVNWRDCPRMALRDGDVISVNGFDITVCHRQHAIDGAAGQETADITHLTADELCDRIVAEQAAVEEFESARREGWQKLLVAIRGAAADQSPAVESHDQSADDCEKLLEQIREISELMDGRTRELDQCEAELSAATALLQETQDRVSNQIEAFLDQFVESTQPVELRASA